MKILHINSYYSTSKFYKNLYENQIKSELDIDVFVPVPSTFENNDFDYGEYSKISKNHNKKIDTSFILNIIKFIMMYNKNII